MALPDPFKRYRPFIEAGLRRVLSGSSSLLAMIRYHVGLEDERGKAIERMGKLLRPSLMLFSAEELGVELGVALPAAIALEMVHNFSLIHDDIQDGDRMRRGRPTVWHQYGVAQAINAGDLLYTRAVDQALSVGQMVAEALIEAASEMIEGQASDLSYVGQNVSMETYLEMVDRKTGALFRCALLLGTLLARTSTGVETDAVALGKEMGRIFQIRDDVLGIWGDERLTGKPVGSDIREKKASLPAVLVWERASGQQRSFLEEISSKEEVLPADVDRILAMMGVLGIREDVEDVVSAHLKKAEVFLARIPLTRSGKATMNELLAYLGGRTS
jgi:geranylgeranyl diphosphate synthase type I